MIAPNDNMARTLRNLGVVHEGGVQPIDYVPGITIWTRASRAVCDTEAHPGQYPVQAEPQAAPLQARRPVPQQQLFTPGEPGQTIPGTTPAKLLGEQLTAQLKSGMAARPSKLKPSTGNRGLFDEERPEQGALFARRPTPLRLVDTGQKSPSGAVVYKLHDGKIVLPYAGSEQEMRAAGSQDGPRRRSRRCAGHRTMECSTT